MSQDRESENALTAFEAALASLTPRADQLDRQRLMFLAGRAAALAELQPLECGDASPLSESQSVVPCPRKAWAWHPVRWLRKQKKSGDASPHSKGARAWPAAFAAMTVVAGVLLVALVLQRTGPEARDRQTIVVSADDAPKHLASDDTPTQPTSTAANDEQLRPPMPWPWNALVLARAEPSDERMLHAGLSPARYDRLLNHLGDRDLRMPNESTTGGERFTERASTPATNRELLEKLLNDAGREGRRGES